jgi:N-acetyl sugar amidotransferase
MKYCARCVTPYNRPNIRFDAAGRCNCAAGECPKAIDWSARAHAFGTLVEEAKARKAAYDCIIPVSGGKDSTWQVVTCLEHGLRPLAVTSRPPSRTPLGERNLRNLVELGVDHFDVTVNPEVEKRFLYQALARFGSPAIPVHMAIFAIPLRLAVSLRVPLVIWGENSAREYGGEEADRQSAELNERWILKYGVTFGTRAADWVGPQLSWEELTLYTWPGDEERLAARVQSLFLGSFFRWDPKETFAVAKRNGFTSSANGALTGHYDYADLDDAFLAIHHWLKWYKFGFTRAFDNLSLEIRNGRMTRGDAVARLRELGEQRPDAAIDAFCAHVGITRGHFFEVVEKFRNPEVWTQRCGEWVIDEFLVPDWSWA